MDGRHISNSEAETEALGNRLAARLMRGDIVLLRGRPGAGKTAFARGLAKGLGYDGYATSPTFTLVNEYDGDLPIYHMDLYRLADRADLEGIGVEEYLYGDGVCVIEWPELIDWQGQAVTVDFEYVGDNKRVLTIFGSGERGI